MKESEFDELMYVNCSERSIAYESTSSFQTSHISYYKYQVFSELLRDRETVPIQAEFSIFIRDDVLRYFRYVLLNEDWEEEGPLFTGFARSQSVRAVLEEAVMYLDEYTRELLNREYEEIQNHNSRYES